MPHEFYQKLDKFREVNNPQATEQFLLGTVRENDEDSSEWLMAKSELAAFYRAYSKFDLAIHSYKEVKDAIVRTTGKNTSDYAITVNNLGGAYRMMGDPANALIWFREAKETYKNLQMSGDYYYATILNNMSLALLDSGDFDGAEQRLLEALNLMESVEGSNFEIVSSMTNLATLYCNTHRLEEARAITEKSLVYLEKNGYDGEPIQAASLNLLAGICHREKKYAEAIPLFKKALEITEKSLGHNVDYGVCCENLALIYKLEGQLQDSLEYLKKASVAFDNIFGMNERAARVHDRIKLIARKLELQ